MFRNKRASLENSIQAIVIVILAMTLLGLGLGFIRGMFKDIGGVTTDVTEQIRQQILNDLITSDQKLSFPKSEIEIDKGGSEVLAVGVRNKKDAPMLYTMVFALPTGTTSTTVTEWFQYDHTEKSLAVADSEVR